MRLISTSATFTRPGDTTAYAANDLVANSTTAGSVVPLAFAIGNSGGFKVWRVSVANSNATSTNSKYNVHLFNSSPTCANGDNGAFSTTVSGWFGSMAVDDTTQAFSDQGIGWGLATTYPLLIVPTNRSGIFYGLLQAAAAYTPANAETFTVTLVGEAYV